MREQESIHIDPDLDAKVADLAAAGDGPLTIAKQVAAVAVSIAPVQTGAYQSGISAERTPHGARVIAADQKSSWIEFGIPSQDQPAQFVLRRSVDGCGLKFTKERA